MSCKLALLCTVLLAALAGNASAQKRPAPAGRALTQADYDRLQRQIDDQRKLLLQIIGFQQQQLQALAEMVGVGSTSVAAADTTKDLTPALTEPVKDPVKDTRVATTKKPPPVKRPVAPPISKETPPAAVPGGKGTIVGKVNMAGGDSGQVWVYVDGVGSASARGASAEMKQQNKSFSPGVLVVQKGTRVEFPNLDPIFHNVFSVTPGAAFDLGNYRQGESKGVTMVKSGVVSVYCNMHPQMVGYILVVPNNVYTRAGKDGFYRLTNVPAGTHKVVAWAPNSKPVVREITVSDAEVVTVEFALTKGKSRAHLNKEGLPYGSYKE